MSLAEPPRQTSLADLGIVATVLPLFPRVDSLSSARAALASTVLESVLGILLASRVWSPNSRLPLSLPHVRAASPDDFELLLQLLLFYFKFPVLLEGGGVVSFFFPSVFLLY